METLNKNAESLRIPALAPNAELGPLEHFSQPASIEANKLARTFTGWAAPLTWGPWVQIAAHGGVVSYDIAYSIIGDTAVSGAVNYYNNGWKTIIFNDSIRITTGNAWAAVSVCFFGNPLGSTIHGSINP